MARILEVAPETGPIDIQVRSRWESPAPFSFCGELGLFVKEAIREGDTDLALRIVNELNVGLVDGDGFSANCVAIGFLEQRFDWGAEELAGFIDSWPAGIKSELQRQIAYQQKMQRKEKRLWGPQLPDGSWKVSIRWRLRHPLLWRKMRRGGTFAG